METEGQKVLKPLYRIRCLEVWVPRFEIAVINQAITIEDRRSQIAWPAWSLSQIPIQNNNPVFVWRSKNHVIRFLEQEIPIDIKIQQIEIVARVETDGRPSLHHYQFRLYIIRNIIADPNPK